MRGDVAAGPALRRLAQRRSRVVISRALAILAPILAVSVWDAPAAVDRAYRRLANKYGFQIDLKAEFTRSVTGANLSVDRLEAELDKFFTALERLPPEFVKKAGLRRVMVCDNLTDDGVSVGGLAWGEVIYLKAGFDDETIYHEIFHVFDPDRTSHRWTKLNPKGFIYAGSEGRPAQLTRQSKRRIEENRASGEFLKHFVSEYAQSHEREDRAETFAAMVFEGTNFLQRCDASEVLKAKMEYIQDLTGKRGLLGKDYWSHRVGLTGVGK